MIYYDAVSFTFVGLEIREVFENEEVIHKPVGDGGRIIEEVHDKDRHEEMGDIIVHSQVDEYSYTNDGVPKKLINFILPLYGRFNAFVRFIKTYEEICLKRKENVALFIILFVDKDDNAYNETYRVINYLQNRYPFSKLKIVPVSEKFARAKALDYGMAQVDMNELLFFIDVDMIWSPGTLQRIRLNTIRNKMAYFPIVFSEYDPVMAYHQDTAPSHNFINEESGYWRLFGFGIMSAYKEDIVKVCGHRKNILICVVRFE